jgi:hypothetical protein
MSLLKQRQEKDPPKRKKKKPLIKCRYAQVVVQGVVECAVCVAPMRLKVKVARGLPEPALGTHPMKME